jgi:TPP-dependent indolepyruvate ferredoxin oxidoreductase alpha subunit
MQGMAKVGIVAAGKPYTDVVEALLEIGLDDQKLSELGVSVYKVGRWG